MRDIKDQSHALILLGARISNLFQICKRKLCVMNNDSVLQGHECALMPLFLAFACKSNIYYPSNHFFNILSLSEPNKNMFTMKVLTRKRIRF